MEAESVSKVVESDLVSWLFSEFPGRFKVLSELGANPKSIVRFDVSTPVLDPKDGLPGDIDALIGLRETPEEALAIEAKRILIPKGAFATRKPNKLRGLAKGARQANGLAARGFHQTWLLVLIATDGRGRNQFNFVGRGPSSELIHIINSTLRGLDLRPEVGVICVELTQPLDKDFRLAAAVGLRKIRDAAPRVQTGTLSEAIGLVLRDPADSAKMVKLDA